MPEPIVNSKGPRFDASILSYHHCHLVRRGDTLTARTYAHFVFSDVLAV
jgi:hypothetical protein